MIGLTLLAVGLVGQWLLGVAIADLLFCQFRGPTQTSQDSANLPNPSFTERAGLGFVLGIAATSGILFLWSLCGGTLGRSASVVITAVGLIAGGPIIYRETGHARKSARQRAIRIQNAEQLQEQRWCQCCQLAVAGLFLATLVQTLITPQHLWDERASFAIKGILLNEDRSVYSRDMADPDFVQYHPRYPLLIPLAEQHVYALLGTVDDRLSKVIFPLMYLGMVLTMAGGLLRHFTSGSAWFFALLTATIPSLVPWEYGFPCGQADAPMACFHGTSVLYLWDAWQRISDDNAAGWFRSAILAGFCAAMAAFTKDEGIAFLLVDAIAVSLVLLFTRRRSYALKAFLAVFGVAAILLLPWLVHRRGLPLTTEANYFGRASLTTILQKQANLQWEIPHLAGRMFWESRTWGLQWWLVPFAMLSAPGRMWNGSQWILLLDIAGSISSLMLAGMLAATEVSEHIGGSSHRFLMQIAPVAILFAAGQLGKERR